MQWGEMRWHDTRGRKIYYILGDMRWDEISILKQIRIDKQVRSAASINKIRKLVRIPGRRDEDRNQITKFIFFSSILAGRIPKSSNLIG